MKEIFEIFSVYGVIGKVFSNFWWIVLPPILFYGFKILWMDFVIAFSKFSWLKSLQWTMLEVIPPKNLEKGPKPMESIFHTFAGVIETDNAFSQFLLGKIRDRFSIELVSLGGEIHFYMRVLKKYKSMVEGSIYAQYPDAEVLEVEDYTQNFPKVAPNKYWDVWGADMELTAEDPIPIRTYDKFEEDITGTMIDPLASFFEILGKLPPGQNVGVQLVLSPLNEDWKVKEMKLIQKIAGRENGGKKGPLDHLLEVFTHLFQGLLGPVEFPQEEKKEQQPLEFRLTPGEKDRLKAIEENLGKNMYQTKMRFLYIGRKKGFDKSNVSGFFGAMRQFNDLNLNNLKPNNISKTYAYYVSVDKRAMYRKRKIYKRYRDRDMDGVKFVFSTSELATVYHFPDMGVKAPALNRVGAKTGSAPFNLPVQ